MKEKKLDKLLGWIGIAVLIGAIVIWGVRWDRAIKLYNDELALWRFGMFLTGVFTVGFYGTEERG